MSDFERYGDYNEYDDDGTGKKTNIVGLLLKLIIALACISVATVLGLRIFLFNYYPDEMKRIYYTEALSEYYRANGGDMNALKQEYPYMYDDKDEGNFFGANVIVFRETGALQLSVRYNKSVFEKFKEKYGVNVTHEDLIFTLEANGGDSGTIAKSVGTLEYCGYDELMMYGYNKLCFEGIDFGEGDTAVEWLRVSITLNGVDIGDDQYLIPVYHNHAEYHKFDEYTPARDEVPQ